MKQTVYIVMKWEVDGSFIREVFGSEKAALDFLDKQEGRADDFQISECAK